MNLQAPAEQAPSVGDIVQLRARRYLVEAVALPTPGDPDFLKPFDSPLLRLACLDDDAQGEPLEVLWDLEVAPRRLNRSDWGQLARGRGFEEPERFVAYLNALRWGSVTSTKAELFQAPYRAGIEVKAYQLEPLRMALDRPRVNLFIADDVGLGKTIEAGLILRELILRQKLRRCVIAVPPSVVRQWQAELRERFGLSFIIYDRDFVARVRRQRGWAQNPFATHKYFIISHALLRDEAYAGQLREWMAANPEDAKRSFARRGAAETCSGQSPPAATFSESASTKGAAKERAPTHTSPGSLLILDEAHHAAPSSGQKYAISSKLTRAVRELAGFFEHRLFLSATPHNGHSNSFSALLEILDPQRFCRGVPVDAKLRDEVMVRRLKADLRAVGEDFPSRKIHRLSIEGLPEGTPELQLSRLLEEYRLLRLSRLSELSASQQASAMLVVTSLQKRLLSSIEAFARTLSVHRDSVERQAAKNPAPEELPLLLSSIDADDPRAARPEAELEAEEDAQTRRASPLGGAPSEQERALLDQMSKIAQAHRYDPDARVKRLLAWIRAEQCPRMGEAGASWLSRRVLIFTEYTDTKRYLEQQLSTAIQGSELAERRILSFHGGIGEARREEIKEAFNAHPSQHPLRILIATDAAREGVNLQNHCSDLFHFDVPWNPGRLEQRNGRLDRKLQKAAEVNCYYFQLPQRAEDRVLDVLMQKTQRIHQELGSLSPVLERKLTKALEGGISPAQVEFLQNTLTEISAPEGEETTARELGQEQQTDRQAKLRKQLDRLNRRLKDSRDWIHLDPAHFRGALSAALSTLGAGALTPEDPAAAAKDPLTARWRLPPLDDSAASWTATLDALRRPREPKESLKDWREHAPIRPVVFSDPGDLSGETVHLHLEHRVVQRLLGRFLSMGFQEDTLSRVCVLPSEELEAPQVILLGRLSIFGAAGSRLHDELIAAAAPWLDPADRPQAGLKPHLQEETEATLRALERASERPAHAPEALIRRLEAHTILDIEALSGPLEQRGRRRQSDAQRLLATRAKTEAAQLHQILDKQRARIQAEADKAEQDPQLSLRLDAAERRELNANRAHWQTRLAELELEQETEPARLMEAYEVKATRIEPVGLVYLWTK